MSIMPLYNIIALPGAKMWLQANVYKELTGKAPAEGERVTLLMQKSAQARAALTADGFHPIGAVGTGTATISATLKGGGRAICTVTVKRLP